MVNPFKVLGKEIQDIANGELPVGDLDAPNIHEASSREALEAYKQYSIQKNLRADRVGFVQSIFDKVSNILLGSAATFAGVFLASNSTKGEVSFDVSEEKITAFNQCKSDVSSFREDGVNGLPQDALDRLADSKEEACEAALESGGDQALLFAGVTILAALALSFVSLLFKQFVTRDQADKFANTNDYYRKAQAEETAKQLDPVLEKTASKYMVSAKGAEWERMLDPEALKSIEEAEQSARA